MKQAVSNAAARLKTPAKQLLIHLPLWILLALVVYYAIPRIDPTAGIDGWGGLWAAIITCMIAALSAFTAGTIIRTHFLHLTDTDEKRLAEAGTRGALAIIALDTLRFLVLFGLIFSAATGMLT